jgi:hypothetical protein
MRSVWRFTNEYSMWIHALSTFALFENFSLEEQSKKSVFNHQILEGL